MPSANLMLDQKGSPHKLGADLHGFPTANILKAKNSAPVKNKRAEGRNSFAAHNDLQSRSFTIGSMGNTERSLTLNNKRSSDDKRISVFKANIPIKVEQIPEIEASSSSDKTEVDDAEDCC